MASNKKIIYLDQNFVSDIAKLSLHKKKDKVKPEIANLFNLIKKGVDGEAFIVPDSTIQSSETSKLPTDLKYLVRSYQGYLGQISFRTVHEIKHNQFIKALLTYSGISGPDTPDWQEAFEKNPNTRLENYKITVDLGLSLPDDQYVTAIQKIRDNGDIESELYKKEIQAQRKHYKEILHTEYQLFLNTYGISIEKAEEFIDSNAFSGVPNIDLFSKLWSKSLSDSSRKKRTEGDLNDIEFLSTYLPYCDIIATDHYMKNVLITKGLDVKYDCKVFSMKQKEIEALIEHIENELKSSVPANSSLFSIVCFMRMPKSNYDVSFLQRLNLAHKKFHNTGKYCNQEVYTSTFLTFPDNAQVEMPEPEEVFDNGPSAFSAAQWAEMIIFQGNFTRVQNAADQAIEEVVGKIPEHLRGAATAIIPDDAAFDHDLQAHDSYLFYDIEEAINAKLSCTRRYKIRIIYLNGLVN